MVARLWVGAAAATVCLGAAMPARAADMLFQAEAQGLTGDCKGEAVRLEGNRDTLTLTGMCASLLVKGVANTVQVTVAPGATIRVEGSQNRVRYATAGAGPAIETFGPDNDVAQGAMPALGAHPPPAAAAPPAAAPPPAPAAAPPAMKPPAEVKAPAKPEAGSLDLAGDDQERLADCAGRDVTVTGSRSAYIIRGACRSLVVRGDLLTVQAVMRPGARIAVTGSGSVVSWAIAGRGAAPVAVVRGPGSRVQRAESIGGVPVR